MFNDWEQRGWNGWSWTGSGSVVSPGFCSETAGRVNLSSGINTGPYRTARENDALTVGRQYRITVGLHFDSAACYTKLQIPNLGSYIIASWGGTDLYPASHKFPSHEWAYASTTFFAPIEFLNIAYFTVCNNTQDASGAYHYVLIDNFWVEPVSDIIYTTLPSTGPNLVNEPGFESGGLANYNRTVVAPAAGGISGEVTSAVPKNGGYSFQVTFTRTSGPLVQRKQAQISQNIILEKDAVYRATVEMYYTTAFPQCSIALGVQEDLLVFSLPTVLSGSATHAPNTWKSYDVLFTAPVVNMRVFANATCTANVPEGGVKVYFDNFGVYKLDMD